MLANDHQKIPWLDLEIMDRFALHQRSAKIQSSGALARSSLDRQICQSLNSSLQHAAVNSFYYREHLSDFAKEIAAINQLAEKNGTVAEFLAVLSSLPYTWPQQLSDGSDQFLAVSHDEVAGITSTSGSSGKPKRIYSSAEDLILTERFFQYGMRLLLESPQQQSVAILMSGSRFGSVGRLLADALAKWDIQSRIYGLPDDIEACMDQLLLQGPSCIVGLPAHLLALARHEKSVLLARSVANILLSGDVTSKTQRNFLAESFHCRVFNHYGLTESGYGAAVECAVRDNCHVREADLLFEIIDPQGNTLTPGSFGEIVFTTLSRMAMPIVRYCTGDRGRLIQQKCSCGSILQRLEVEGRLENAIHLPDGDSISLQELNELFALPQTTGCNITLHEFADGPNSGAQKKQCLSIIVHTTALLDSATELKIKEGLSVKGNMTIIHTTDELNKVPDTVLPVILFTQPEKSDTPAKNMIKRTRDRPLFSLEHLLKQPFNG